MKKLDVRTLVTMGLLIALSFVGAQMKLFGTIALDALPAFFGAIFLGPIFGGIVGLIGHLFTAITSGFPLSLPVHIVVSITMFISCAGFGYVYKLSTKTITKGLGVLTGILLNGPFSLGCSALLLGFMAGKETGIGVFVSMFIPLLIGASVNVILAALIYEATKNRIKYL